MSIYLEYINNLNPLYKDWLSYKIDPTVETIPPFMEKGNKDCVVEYYLNSDGMRCDEYSSTDVLFAGCEFTMPINMTLEDGWAYKVHKNNFSSSPYICLSYPGSSVDRIIGNIFKYFNKFGNPKTLFLFAPELNRSVGYWQESNMFKPKIYRQFAKNKGEEHNYMAIPHDLPIEIMALNYLTSIKNLEVYCKNAGINLLWTSWDFDTNVLLNDFNLSSFIFIGRPFHDNNDVANTFIERLIDDSSL